MSLNKLFLLFICISCFTYQLKAQLLIADYPLSTNSADQTGNFGDIIYGVNGTPPPTAACANGIYTGQQLNNGFGTFSTPPLNPLFTTSNFQFDVDFKVTALPANSTLPMPILTLGPLFRTIGVCISTTGALGIIYNNGNYLFSEEIISAGQFYSVSLKYLAGNYHLLLNGTAVLNGTLPALQFAPANLDDMKLYAANGSNGKAFNGCISKLKIYSCPSVTPAINIVADNNYVCHGTPVSFIATATNGGAQPTYQWKINGTNAGTSNPIFIPRAIKDKDKVSCILISSNVCANPLAATSNTIEVSVKSKPIISSDTSLCATVMLELQASDALSYEWSPAVGLNNTNIQKPVFTAGSSNSAHTYFLTVTDYENNLVTNGDFEQGNTGFTTGYTNCSSSNCLFPLADNGYSIGNDATFFHALFKGKDHTSGNGNFMIINGAKPELTVWKQTISVLPNTGYAFGTWINTLIAQHTASIRFSINGVQLDNVFPAPANTNQWVRYFTTWNSGNKTSATIEIVDVLAQASGNDFGLDDIFFGTINACTDSIKLTVTGSYNGLPDTIKVCKSSTILDAGAGFTSYQWSTGATSQTITVSQPGRYKVSAGNGNCFFKDSTFIFLQATTSIIINDTICFGQSYGLPSGKKVFTSGIYNDTLKNRNGCDSILITANIHVFSPSIFTISQSICDGMAYPLPSGKLATKNGIYKDTLTSHFGCDSIITLLTLMVTKPQIKQINSATCDGQFYTLPSGKKVNSGGIYPDTVRSITACDSIIYTVNLSVVKNTFSAISTSLCTGQSYTLPSGKSVSKPGVYIDTLQNSAGCDSIITTTITNQPPLKVVLNKPAPVCSTKAVTLVATASGGSGGSYTYKWSAGGANQEQLVLHPAATIAVAVSVTDGCTLAPAADTVIIMVNPKPTPGFTIDHKEGCIPLAAIFTNTTQPAAAYTYQWDFGDGSFSNAESPAHIYTNSGLYDAGLTVTNSEGCSDSFKLKGIVQAFVKPVADFSVDPSPNTTGNLKFQFTDKSMNGEKWLWNFGDNVGISAIHNPMYIYKNSGNYKVSLIANSGSNCSDTAFKNIEIKGYNGVYIPNVFTPNGDGKNDEFKILGTGIQSAEMQIINRWGEVIFRLTGNPPVWDGRNSKSKTASPAGNYIYLIKLTGSNGNPVIYKGNILVQK